jgi:ubiquinone/menaquinone biosynthesis C-methylase UbiE
MDYNTISKGYDELYGEEQIKKEKIILKNINIKKTDWLLDVGCGTGISTELFKCNKIGIDPSEKLIEQAIKRIPAIIGKGEKLPFENNTFDIIICLTAIHNFDNPEKGISEMKRVCKNDGKIIITILKKSKKNEEIKKTIKKNLFIEKEIDEEKDIILICRKDF